MLTNNLRLQYLQAMGIEVWLPTQSLCSDVSRAAEAFELQGVIEIPIKTITNLPAQTQVERPITNNTLEPWECLQAKVSECTQCPLCSTRTQTVFGTGNLNADWLLIGDAPGQTEDEQGLPFLDEAGLLLTEMLRAIGIDRDEVFMTTVLKCRPPHDRAPHVGEIARCTDYLQQQIALINPKIILAVGRIAAHALLNSDESLIKLRGRIHEFNKTPVVVIYHPKYLLRSLPEKRKAWQDLQLAVNTIKRRE